MTTHMFTNQLMLGKLQLTMLCLVLDTTVFQAQEISEPFKQRFLSTAPVAWSEYVDKSLACEGFVTQESTGTINNSHYQDRFEFRDNKDCRLIRYRVKETLGNEIDQDYETVCGLNPKYGFVLDKSRTSDNWLLNDYYDRVKHKDTSLLDRRIKIYQEAITYPVRLPYGNELLADIIRKPEFIIEQCQPLQKDDSEYVEMQFHYIFIEQQTRTSLKGKLLLDPNCYWCWQSGQLTLDGSVNGEVTFAAVQSNRDQGLPHSRKWTIDAEYRHSSNAWTNKVHRAYEAQLSSRKDYGDHEFTLSAFGLPEPAGVTWEKPTPFYVWIAIGAGVFALLAIIFRYLARRQRPVTT